LNTPSDTCHAEHYDRLTSRGETDFADTILSAMRFQLGGRQEKK